MKLRNTSFVFGIVLIASLVSGRAQAQFPSFPSATLSKLSVARAGIADMVNVQGHYTTSVPLACHMVYRIDSMRYTMRNAPRAGIGTLLRGIYDFDTFYPDSDVAPAKNMAFNWNFYLTHADEWAIAEKFLKSIRGSDAVLVGGDYEILIEVVFPSAHSQIALWSTHSLDLRR